MKVWVVMTSDETLPTHFDLWQVCSTEQKALFQKHQWLMATGLPDRNCIIYEETVD